MRTIEFISRSAISVAILALAACSPSSGAADDRPSSTSGGTRAAPEPAANQAVAIFAGGCFWCMEGPFESIEGVESVLSGYAGGDERAPTYDQVSSGRTGHTEAVRVLYDPERVSYAQLLEVFWHNVDPFDADGQFCDRGSQYRPAIFPVDAAQRRAAERSKREVARRLERPIAVRLESTDAFWVAEDYHQDFYRTNPERYRSYRRGCGRDARLREVWGTGGH